MEKLTDHERELLLEIVGEHLSEVKSGSIVYTTQSDVIEVLRSILVKVAAS